MVNLKSGQFYDIIYTDPNYPCKCICHTSLSVVKHIIPCCRDQSFQFFNAEYVGWGDKGAECFKINGQYIDIDTRRYRTVQFIPKG